MRRVHFSRPYPDGQRILIVGDSTAVGTGARTVDKTIAGRLAKDFPHTDILNLAVNGSITSDVIGQLKKAGDDKFDMIIISTGGNDVWNYMHPKKLYSSLIEVLDLAKSMSSGHVVVLFFGNEGSAPLMPFFIRGMLMRRTSLVKDVFAQACKGERIHLVELFTTTEDNPFVVDPRRFFAWDGLHPSGEGYRIWYDRMWRIMAENGYLYHEAPASL